MPVPMCIEALSEQVLQQATAWFLVNRFGLLRSKALVNSTQADALLARCSGSYTYNLASCQSVSLDGI